MACWLDQTPSNNELCDAIDEIMRPEHEDVILLDDPLSPGDSLELNLDPFSDLLDNPSTMPSQRVRGSALSAMSPSSSTADYSQPLNIYDISSPPCSSFAINNPQTNAATSPYSCLGISPQFTTLSINQHRHPAFSPPSHEGNYTSKLPPAFAPSSMGIHSKNNLRPPPYGQQQDSSILNASYPVDSQMNSGPSDVKRFRSASMNEGATQQQQQAKLGRSLCRLRHCHTLSRSISENPVFDTYRIRASTYVEPSYSHHHQLGNSSSMTTTSSTSSISTDMSSSTTWSYGTGTRSASNSFSEMLSQQQPPPAALRTNNALSSSYAGSSSFYPLHHPSTQSGFLPDLNFQPPHANNCTLYSLNQPTAATGRSPSASSPSSAAVRKRTSLIGFPVEEIKGNSTVFA